MEKKGILKLTDSLQELLQNQYEIVIGGSFLLGLNMGMSCNCSNKIDGIAWVKRNFGHHDFLINAIDKAMEKERICPRCETQNSLSDNFCSGCGLRIIDFSLEK